MSLDDYPQELYASVLLLDGKIESWKVVDYPKRTPGDFKAYWKRDRLNDYSTEVKSWTVDNYPQKHDVFEKLAPQWFSQWPHADDYRGFAAYETDASKKE